MQEEEQLICSYLCHVQCDIPVAFYMPHPGDGHCNDCEAGHPRAGSGHFSYGRLESFLVLMESRVFFCKERQGKKENNT